MSQMMPEYIPDNGEITSFQEQDALRSALQQNDEEQLIDEAMSIIGAGSDMDFASYPTYLDEKLLELIDAVPLDEE